jgi:hypothetical protein
MVGEEEDVSENHDYDDSKDDNETKVAKIEVGDNYVVVANELENGDPLFDVLCNKPTA